MCGGRAWREPAGNVAPSHVMWVCTCEVWRVVLLRLAVPAAAVAAPVAVPEPVAPAADAMPPNWHEAKDPASQGVYVWGRWCAPPRTVSSLCAVRRVLNRCPCPLCPPDPRCAPRYYYNSVTGETSWTRPVVTPPLAPGWAEAQDSEGKMYVVLVCVCACVCGGGHASPWCALRMLLLCVHTWSLLRQRGHPSSS